MKKILFLIPTLDHGGAEKVLVNLVNNLDPNKYDITVQTIMDIGVNKKFLKEHIKYKSIFKKRYKGITTILKFFSPNFLYSKFISSEFYDIEIAYLEGACARIISGNRIDRNPIKIAWIHTEITNDKELRIGFRNANEARLCYKNFNKVVSVSEVVKNKFIETTGINIENSIVLYNINETDKIIKLSEEDVENITFNKNVFNICSVGKIINSKNFMTLAKIHKRLLDSNIQNHVYILGVGPEQYEIERYLKQVGLTNSFTFLGYQENPYKYVSKCDLYVCCSKKEGFSTAVTESLIVGTPVVTTPCSGMKEMLGENNEYGIIVNDSEYELYEAIESILKNEEILEHYTVKAKERSEFFGKNRIIQSIEEFLNSF